MQVGKTVKVVGTLDSPSYVVDILSLGMKHPINDKFNETHFLADFDTFLRKSKSSGATSEQLNSLNSKVVGYVKSAKKQRLDRLISKVNQLLKSEQVKAVPFIEGSGYCLMSEFDYNNRILDILNRRQFEKMKVPVRGKPFVVKIEDQFNKELFVVAEGEPCVASLL